MPEEPDTDDLSNDLSESGWPSTIAKWLLLGVILFAGVFLAAWLMPVKVKAAPSDAGCITAAFNVEDFRKEVPGGKARAFEGGEAISFLVAFIEMFPPPGPLPLIAGISLHVVPNANPDDRRGVEMRLYGKDGCEIRVGANLNTRTLNVILHITGIVWPDLEAPETPA